MMREWNEKEQEYLRLDLLLVSRLPDLVTEDLLTHSLGDKAEYTFEGHARAR